MGALKKFFHGFKEGFTSFSHGVANVVNSVLLSIVYVLAVGATSLAARAAKKQFLNLGQENKTTYWEDLNLEKKEKEYYYNQF